MALIFDRFPSRADAEAFAAAVGTDAIPRIYDTQAESNADEPFPYPLTPPIVLLARHDSEARERELERRVTDFGGRFAGT